MSNRFSSDSLVYSSIDDIPKSGSCFGTISKSIKIGTITIPAYSRFSFINTGTSTDGALFAIDSDGNSYTAYRTSGVWNKCFATATKSDLPKYDIKTFTVDVTTQNANSNGKYYTEKKLSTESWYSSAKAIVPLFARKSGSAYICMAEIEYETLRVQADIAISGVTVGILVVS